MTGLAAASCFPEAVRQAAAGTSLPMVLGGICGLLPDTLDFKVLRYFARSDLQVAPDPLNPCMRDVAETVACAVRNVFASGKPCQLQLHTLRQGADIWQPYELVFDTIRKRVAARLLPVDAGEKREEDRALAVPIQESRAPLACPLYLDYTAAIRVDILDGPVLRLEPEADGVAVRFIPWHRKWSHSLVFSLLLGLTGWAIASPLIGGIMLTAHAAHVLADHAGWMGSSLFYPFSRRRRPGLGFWFSGSRQVNFAVVWLSCLLIFWNLYAQAAIDLPFFNPVGLFFWGALLPAGLSSLWRRKRSF